MSAPEKLVIATRASRLALWQAEHVRALLRQLYPACEVSLLEMTTRGDQILDRTLSKVGGKGLFVKELETALLDGRADLAVHSLKDVPVELTHPFALPVILQRDDPRDAFVSNDYKNLADMPAGAVVGTSSLRRESQVRAAYPHLTVKPLRGNLDTRFGKLDRGEYGAIILAAVGLRRLNLHDRIRCCLEPVESLPAAGQGALGIEIMAERQDLANWLAPLACSTATACSLAERAVSRVLGGSCQVPLAAYAELQGETVHLNALVAEADGTTVIRASGSSPVSQAQSMGESVARELMDKGAKSILDRLSDSSDASQTGGNAAPLT